jgi:hypothetical protein
LRRRQGNFGLDNQRTANAVPCTIGGLGRSGAITWLSEEIMSASFPIENRSGVTAEDFARIANAVASHGSIRQALIWFLGHNPPLVPSEMVTQDEFSHDILVAYPGDRWLAYSTT